MDSQIETTPATAPAKLVPPKPPPVITLTEKALSMVKQTMESENMKDHGLRVSVEGGGCSGFQYSLNLEPSSRAGDFVFDHDGINVFIDPMSAQYLRGTTIDFVETAYQSGFKFENPKAKSTCGCGSSFSV